MSYKDLLPMSRQNADCCRFLSCLTGRLSPVLLMGDSAAADGVAEVMVRADVMAYERIEARGAGLRQIAGPFEDE